MLLLIFKGEKPLGDHRVCQLFVIYKSYFRVKVLHETHTISNSPPVISAGRIRLTEEPCFGGGTVHHLESLLHYWNECDLQTPCAERDRPVRLRFQYLCCFIDSTCSTPKCWANLDLEGSSDIGGSFIKKARTRIYRNNEFVYENILKPPRNAFGRHFLLTN